MSTVDAAGANGPQFLFLHANGFPTGVYRQFLTALARFGAVDAPEVINTPGTVRASRRWPHMTEQTLERIHQLADEQRPLVLVGHSMGGYLSLMAAARARSQVAAVVLVDSPLVLGWRRPFLESMRLTGLSRYGGPAPIAARRRFQWNSADEARDHLSAKAFCRHWADGVMDDFIEHGLVPAASTGVALRISREIERDIYAHLPGRRTFAAYKRLRNQGIPVFLLAGKHSREMQMAGALHNRQVFQQRLIELPAGHLIPMEVPQLCAEAVGNCVAEVMQTSVQKQDEAVMNP